MRHGWLHAERLPGRRWGRILAMVWLCVAATALLADDAVDSGETGGDEKADRLDEAVKNVRVDELLNCLINVMGSDSSQSPNAYAALSGGKEKQYLEQACTNRRVLAYEPENTASYAMGVSFQDKVLERFDSLNWVDFINGLLRAEGSGVKVSRGGLERILTTTLMGPAEASQQYLDTLRENAEYQESSGVYFRVLAGQRSEGDDAGEPAAGAADRIFASKADVDVDRENHSRSWASAFNEQGACDEAVSGGAKERRVRFHLVKPIYTPIDTVDSTGQSVDCVQFDKDDVIRGWRLLLGQLEPELIYDVLVPSELAYGASGIPGLVEGGEHLRFLMSFDD